MMCFNVHTIKQCFVAYSAGVAYLHDHCDCHEIN